MLKTIIKINNKEFDIKDIKSIKDEISNINKELIIDAKELEKFIKNLEYKDKFLNIEIIKTEINDFNLAEKFENEYDFKGGFDKEDFKDIVLKTSGLFPKEIIIKNAKIHHFDFLQHKKIHFENCIFEYLNIQHIKKQTLKNCKVTEELYINDNNILEELDGLDYKEANINLKIEPVINYGKFINYKELINIKNKTELLFGLLSLMLYLFTFLSFYSNIIPLMHNTINPKESIGNFLFLPFDFNQSLEYVYILIMLLFFSLIFDVYKNIDSVKTKILEIKELYKEYGFDSLITKFFYYIEKPIMYLLYFSSLYLIYLLTTKIQFFLLIIIILAKKIKTNNKFYHLFFNFFTNIGKTYCFFSIISLSIYGILKKYNGSFEFYEYLMGVLVSLFFVSASIINFEKNKQKINCNQIKSISITCDEIYNLPSFIKHEIDLKNFNGKIDDSELDEQTKSRIFKISELKIKEESFNITKILINFKTSYSFMLSIILSCFLIYFGGKSIFTEEEMIISDSTVYSYAVMKQYDDFCNVGKESHHNEESCRKFKLGDKENYYPSYYPEYNSYLYSLESLMSPFELEQTKHFRPKEEMVGVWTYIFKFAGLLLWVIIFGGLKEMFTSESKKDDEDVEK